MATALLRRFYAPEYLVKDSMKCGEIPGTKEIYANALHVAGPSVIEFFLISLIMMADTVMVSGVGPEAIAAVGITTQPRFIVQSLVLAMNVGVTAVTARRYGEKDHAGAVYCLKQTMVICACISVLTSTAAIVYSRGILLFSGAQPDMIDAAQAYFIVIMAGLPLNSLSLTVSAALRGIGQTRAPMVINMTANIVNVCCNYLLIEGRLGFPRLEVRGAAIATAIGWGVGLALCAFALLRRSQYFFVLGKAGWIPRGHNVRAVYKVASGAFIEQICMRIGFLIYSKMISNLGTLVFATHQIAINILSLSFSIGEGLSLAAASLVGQNMGAKRPDLSTIYGKALQRMSLIYSVALMLVFQFFGRGLMMIFSDIPQVLDTGKDLLVIAGILVLFQASQMIFMGALRGAGDTMFTAIISMISVTIIRPVVALILIYPLGLGVVGAWLAFLMDQLIRLSATYVRFSSGKWVNIRL